MMLCLTLVSKVKYQKKKIHRIEINYKVHDHAHATHTLHMYN